MTVSKTPPGRGIDLDGSRSGALTPVGPQKCVRCSGSVRQRNTSSRGASNTRVNLSSPKAVVVIHVRFSFPLRAGLPIGFRAGARRACRTVASRPAGSPRSTSSPRRAPAARGGTAGTWRWRLREISPQDSSTLRCLEIPGRLIANGAANSFTVASPCASRATIARRVGSASAANVASSRCCAAAATSTDLCRTGCAHSTSSPCS